MIVAGRVGHCSVCLGFESDFKFCEIYSAHVEIAHEFHLQLKIPIFPAHVIWNRSTNQCEQQKKVKKKTCFLFSQFTSGTHDLFNKMKLVQYETQM